MSLKNIISFLKIQNINSNDILEKAVCATTQWIPRRPFLSAGTPATVAGSADHQCMRRLHQGKVPSQLENTWDQNMYQEKKIHYGKFFDFCAEKCVYN